MLGFGKKNKRAPRGRYTTVHDERMAMDAIYAAKHQDEKDADAEMLAHVDALTLFASATTNDTEVLREVDAAYEYDVDDWPDDLPHTYTGAPDECSLHWPKKENECGCDGTPFLNLNITKTTEPEEPLFHDRGDSPPTVADAYDNWLAAEGYLSLDTPAAPLVKEVDPQLEMLLNEEALIELSYGEGDPFFLVGKFCKLSGHRAWAHGDVGWRVVSYLGYIQVPANIRPRITSRAPYFVPCFDHAYIVAYARAERVVLASQMRNVR